MPVLIATNVSWMIDVNPLTPTVAILVQALSVRVPGCQKLQMTA